VKAKTLPSFFIIGLAIAITSCFIAFAATDAPHNASNNIDCGSCHGVGLLNSPFWGGTMSYDQLCRNCHKASSGPYSETNAPLVVTHSSETTSDKYGDWARECRNCHNPHYQRQKLYKNTDANNLYLATGTITNCVYNGDNTSTLTYSTITYKTGWDAARLTEKTSGYRRTILFPNVNKLGYNYPIKAVDTPTANTITVTGNSCTYLYPPTTFAAIYGQYIKDTIDVNGTNKQVKFFDQTGNNSYADGDGTYNGVCEVCHTQTDHFRNNGEAPDQNHSNIGEDEGTNCIFCHNHIDGLSHFASEGMGCDACHGKDSDNGGAGTTASHSTHMENDADDLKGPHTDCFDCHDIDNFPKFADGADTLAATTVCDNCHSPGGGYNGVAMAKANWDTGIYESNGVTLRSGKDLWCATCHDYEPAFSTSQIYEIIMDNPDADFEGTWTTGSNTDQYGDSVAWKQIPATPNGTATWRPTITYAGQYSVYAWWTVHSNRAKDAPYTIYYDGGSATVDVNQEINGGKWNYLGTYPFAEGTDGYVVLSDNSAETGQYVIADAVKFEIGPQGIFAPKVIGDNSTYGYYVTGHGANGLVHCLHCHDASDTHIDHEARTYDAGVNSYCDSYRLREIDGQPGLDIPRSSGGALANWRDFALCFECHDRYAVIGTAYNDVDQTNFWDADADPNNSHWYHLGMGNNIYDSDYDGTTDSSPTCPTCHNVHGSPTGPMIRHGELISPYGTTSYVPSYNFYYYLPGDGSATATFTPTLSGGTYRVYAWWSVHTNRATNAKYLINHDGGQDEVVVNQEINGGQWNLLGTYTITTASGSVILTSEGANEYIMADAIGWDSDGVFFDDWNCDGIPDPEVLIDDPDATYTGTWTYATNNSYGTTYRRDSSTVDGDSVTWTPNIPSSGNYSVYAWWYADTNRATDAPYTITHDLGSEIVNKNQRIDGGTWNLLGTYQFASGTSGSVKLDETVTGRIIADAIGWDSDGVFTDDWNCDGVNDPEIIIDDPGASFTGSWTTLAQDARYKRSTTYYFAPILNASASAIDSVGATMQSGGLNSNHSCGT
jgi:hypothetical protein